MRLACTDRAGLLEHVFARLARGEGGWLITANLDFLRRYARDPASRRLYDRADVSVADGMPLVWAARAQGDRLPGRIAGSDLVLPLAERAAREQKRLYLLGGEPAANARAVEILRERWPALVVAGHSSPRVDSPPTEDQLATLRDEMVRTSPDLLLVGLGSPKQEQVIDALRATLPRAWMVGVGVSFSFVSGDVRRAPLWMQRLGLEWLSRMLQEPRRLVRRYLVDDLPFFFELMTRSLWRRVTRRRARP